MTHTVNDIAKLFGVHEGTVLAWIASGELKAVNVGVSLARKKPRWRITEKALEDFQLLRASMPPATPTPRKRRKAQSQSSDLVFYK